MKNKKYLTFEESRAIISTLGLKTRREYLNYVNDNNIKHLSPTPEPSFYHKGWSGWADFLGLTQEQYLENKKNQYVIVGQERKSNPKPTKAIKVKSQTPKVNAVSQTVVGLDPDKVIQFLITEDVAPDTIVKMVAEMDIKSSALMNDLCKYMQTRSKRQEVTWRPTGYNTAEPQMSLKI